MEKKREKKGRENVCGQKAFVPVYLLFRDKKTVLIF